MLQFLFLFLAAGEPEKPTDIGEKLLMIAATAFITAFFSWFFLRPKQNAETYKIGSDAEKNYSEIIAAWQEKLSVWIDRFETAKEDAVKLEDTATALRRELDNCVRGKESCQQFREKAKVFFDLLESSFKDLTEYAPLLQELRRLKTEMEAEKQK